MHVRTYVVCVLLEHPAFKVWNLFKGHFELTETSIAATPRVLVHTNSSLSTHTLLLTFLTLLHKFLFHFPELYFNGDGVSGIHNTYYHAHHFLSFHYMASSNVIEYHSFLGLSLLLNLGAAATGTFLDYVQ